MTRPASQAARKASRSIRAASYHARYVSRPAPDAEPLVREGEVVFRRWEAERRKPRPGIPPATLEADIRMDFIDGIVYAYDGDRLQILRAPGDVLEVPVTVGGEQFITGNVAGRLVETPLLDGDLLPELSRPDATWKLLDRKKIGKVLCEVIETTHPGTRAGS